MLLKETFPAQSLGVDARIYCHPCANSSRTDTWKSPASELFPVFCGVSYNRRSYPRKLQVGVKAGSTSGLSNPGRAGVNLVLKDDLSLTRWYSAILSTFIVSVVRTWNLDMSKVSWKQKAKFGERRWEAAVGGGGTGKSTGPISNPATLPCFVSLPRTGLMNDDTLS